jgi:biotin carboxyl carrier protein
LKSEFIIDGETHCVSLEKSADGFDAVIDGIHRNVLIEEMAPGHFIIEKDNRKFRVMVRPVKEKAYVWIGGETLVLERPTEETAGSVATGSDSHLNAPMPGTLSKLLVEVGQNVEEKQTVAILEAMKMEHNLRAPRAGIVAKIFFKEGDILDADATVLDLEPIEEDVSS